MFSGPRHERVGHAVKRGLSIDMRDMRGSRVGPLVTGLFCLVFVVIGYGLGHRAQSPHSQPAPVTVDSPAAMLVRDHDRLIVRDQSPLQQRLVVAPVAVRDGVRHMTFPGQVMAPPDRQVNVLSPATGLITQVLVRLGDHVARGQVLATLAAGDLAQAWADDRRARATLDFARRAYGRANGVQAIGGNAVKDLQSAGNDLAQARAEADRTAQHLRALSSRPDYAAQGLIALVAPIDGFVATTHMAPGQNVMDSTAVQMTLVDLSTVWVSLAIPEDHIATLTADSRVTATFPGLPDYTCHGTVLARDPVLMPDTRRLNLYVACPNPDGALRPGLFANAETGVDERDAMIVPKTALLMNNDRVSVFVETAPNTFQRRFIGITYDEGDSVRVVSGLTPGERIVTRGAILLNDD